jgi:hypothetical protein
MQYRSLAIIWGSDMLKLPLALGMLLALATGIVAQTAPPELPLAITCWSPSSRQWIVGYLATIKEDGTATYQGGRLSATVNAKTRVVEPPGNRPPGLDCYGKTLDEPRSSGRVMEFQRAR